jgi:integrase/recombinase XerC
MKPPTTLETANRPLPFTVADEQGRRGTKILRVLFATCRSEHTRRAYALDIELFRRFLEMGYGAKLSPAQVIDRLIWGGTQGQTHSGHAHELADYYGAWQETQGKAASTIRRRLATLKAIARAARRLGLIAWTLELRSSPAMPARSTAGPGKATVTAILSTLDADGSLRAVRNRAILRLLYDVALRRGEVAGLDMGDLDLGNRRIRIKGKGRTSKEWISVPAPTVAAMRAWLAQRSTAAGPVFTTLTARGTLRTQPTRLSGFGIYKLIREYGLGQGVKMWPHGLRHSGITEAVKAAGPAGIDITEVLQFSRHRRLDTLMIYRDQVRDVQGTLAAAVADTVEADPSTPSEPGRIHRRRGQWQGLRLTLAE